MFQCSLMHLYVTVLSLSLTLFPDPFLSTCPFPPLVLSLPTPILGSILLFLPPFVHHSPECRNGLVGVGLFKSSAMGAISVDKDASTMSRFLNRILGLPVQLQNQLFAYFSDTLAAVVQRAKRTGHWDGGILDFGSSGEHVEIVATEKYSASEDRAYNVASAELYTVGNVPFSAGICWGFQFRVW